MTTPAGGIEPDTEADEATTFMGLAPEVRRRMWQVAMTPEPRDPGYIDEPGYAFFNDALKRCEGLASTATASPQSTKVQRVYFHRYGTPGIEDHIDIPLRDDPRRHVDHALIHRVLLVPSEHLTERSALQPEAPCEDRAFALGMDARLRAAGFAGLLAEIRGAGAIREHDYPDLCDRIDMAIADQEAARNAAMKERP